MNHQTVCEKLWQNRLVCEEPDGTSLPHIDRHRVNEVTRPQACEGRRREIEPWLFV